MFSSNKNELTFHGKTVVTYLERICLTAWKLFIVVDKLKAEKSCKEKMESNVPYFAVYDLHFFDQICEGEK